MANPLHYEISDGSSIRIIYGSDAAAGVFLLVIDRRLQSKPEASDEANNVAKAISSDGCGYYLHLHTGDVNIGKKVSKATMADFMGRYGVPKERIDELLGLSSISMYNPPCKECLKATKLRCSKCKWKFYCSKECHQANWPRHKHFCAIKVLPEKRVKVTSSKKSVYGVLLMPEKEAKPKFVEVTMNFVHLEDVCDDPFWLPKFDEFIQGQLCRPLQWGGGFGVRTGNTTPKSFDEHFNPIFGDDSTDNRPDHMENTLQFYFRDNFMNDGSKLNECVRKISDGKAPHPWAGPILVLKVAKKNWTETSWMQPQQDEFMDVKLEDCEEMIDFFMLYGK